jgi:manganese/zinc/iron transport system permease protein
VDLDPDCVLNGQLERVFWFPPRTWPEFLHWSTLAMLPRELVTLAMVAAATGVLVALFFKELRIVTFDPELARALGIPAGAIRYGLMLVVAAAVVASFEAVGSILVVAMLVCPAATARLLTDQLARQVWLSAVVAVIIGIGGYVAAAYGPLWLGGQHSLSGAGMMAAWAGVLMLGAIIGAPHHGLISRALRRARTAAEVAREDLLAELYKAGEQGRVVAIDTATGFDRRALERAVAAGQVERVDDRLRLTTMGHALAREVVRAHRLWENYLVDQVGLEPTHVHDTAMRLEHVTDRSLSKRLAASSGEPSVDPHGRSIPDEAG